MVLAALLPSETVIKNVDPSLLKCCHPIADLNASGRSFPCLHRSPSAIRRHIRRTAFSILKVQLYDILNKYTIYYNI